MLVVHCRRRATALVAISLVGLAGCEGRGGGTGTPTTPPGINPVFTPVTINGTCYLTNGTLCVPCDGGQVTPCSSLVGGAPPSGQPVPIDEPDIPADPQSIPDRPPLNEQFEVLAGGLDGDSYQIATGLWFWRPGDAVTLPVRLHHADEHSGRVEVSLLWRSDWTMPDPSALSVRVHLDGDRYDDQPDLMLLRMSGDIKVLRRELHGMLDTAHIRLDNGFTWSW